MENKQLWAPWRLAYVTDEKKEMPLADLDFLPGADEKCFICQCAVDSDDRSRFVVERGDVAITVLNRYPYNNGHLLVSPMRHVARLDELTAEETAEISATLTRMVGRLEEVVSAQGFNIGLNMGDAAGAGLPGHLHWHIVPRWVGDTNFMPSVAGTKVIPQALEALWEALRAAE